MKARWLMVILLASILTGVLNNFKATAQSNTDFSLPIEQILNRLTRNCEISAQVNYRSQKLMSPDRQNSVYIEATLTRSGRRGSRVVAGQCLDTNLETSVATMIVENQTGVRRINLLSIPRYGSGIKNHHSLINPISWSSDSRYLMLKVETISSPEITVNYLLVDSINNYQPINVEICANADIGGDFLGFRSSSLVAAFKCESLGDPSYIELIDWQSRSIRRINRLEARERLQFYGRVSSPVQILQDSQIATGRSPNSGQQTATGRSPATSGSRQELVASNLGCTRNLRTILGQRAPDYCTSADAYSGIIFDNVKPPTRNADGSIKLEMTVLNRGSADGFVEVYDSQGNLVKLEVIESSSPPTDLIRNINPFDERSFPASFFSNYPIGDLRRSLKRQDINVTIPAGGYAKVTKYGNVAFRYNAAMLALELAQAAKGDPEFVKSEPVKNFIKGFAEEAFFASDSKAVINIFKSSPSLQAQFNMNVIDPNKLAKVLQELVEYSVKIEKDPSKNPFIGAFQDVFLDGANIGLENAVNLLLPGLGTFASGVRKGGNYINTLARAADLYYSMASGEKATVTIRDASTTGGR